MAVAIYRMIKKNRAQTVDTEKKSKPSPCPHKVSALAKHQSKDNAISSPPLAVDKSGRCLQCKAEKSAARKYRWRLILSLAPAFFLSSLDFTIVATALPFIASHFDKLNQLNWIVTSFTLTSTAFIPIFGQLADTFGRHSTIQLSTALVTIGSILCAAAPAWSVLLLGRALQGIGTAGIQNVVTIILADSVSLKEQAINTSIFQMVNGVGYAVGPVIGGYLTNADWRYCFVLCAATGAVSCVTVWVFLRSVLRSGTISITRPPVGQTHLQSFASGLSSLDFGGIVLFIFGVGLIILGTAWGGSTYPWSSAAVVSSLAIGSVLLAAFVTHEYFFEPDHYLQRRFPKIKPLIPFSLLSNKDITLVCIIAAATGAALYSVFYFIGIYFTLVEAYSASKAGLQLLYYIPGIGIGTYLAVYLCNFRPRQTFWPLFLGTVVETAGLAILTWAVKARNSTLVNVMMGITGVGTGVRFMPMNLHFSGMFQDQLAASYSILRFAAPFGGTLALTIMGSVFQNKMAGVFSDPAGGTTGTDSGSTRFNTHTNDGLNVIEKLPAAAQAVVRGIAADATMWAFISILPFMAFGLIASMGLGNVWISPRDKDTPIPEADEAVIHDEKHNTTCNVSADKGSQPATGHDHTSTESVQPASTSTSDVSRSLPLTSDSIKKPIDFSGGSVYDGIYLLGILRGTVRNNRRPTMAPALTEPVN